MRHLIAAAGVLALSAAASAATLKVPQQYETIQDAVNAAVEGDTIVVSRGVYFESVVVGTPNLRILGKKAVLDGTIGTFRASRAMELNADGITVQGLAFRNGGTQLRVDGNSCRILKCVFTDAWDSAVVVGDQDGTEISGCRVQGSGQSGIVVGGDAGNFGSITRNTVRQTGGHGIHVSGGFDGLVEGNVVRTTHDQGGIYVSASGSTVASNRTTGVAGIGIGVYGDESTVTGNLVVRSGSTGVEVYGQDCVVEGNDVRDSGTGIYVSGNGARVLANEVQGTHSEAYGILVGGDGITVSGNDARDGYNYSIGFYIYSFTSSGGGVVEDNSASGFPDGGFSISGFHNGEVRRCAAVECGSGYSGFGFYASGSGLVLEDCSATDCDLVGFDLRDDVTLLGSTALRSTMAGIVANGPATVEDCSAFDCGGAGFVAAAPGVTLTGGTYLRNRQDVTRMVSWGATFSAPPTGVTFETGGFDQDCSVFIAND